MLLKNTDTLVKHRPAKKKSVTVFNLEREVFMCVSLILNPMLLFLFLVKYSES